MKCVDRGTSLPQFFLISSIISAIALLLRKQSSVISNATTITATRKQRPFLARASANARKSWRHSKRSSAAFRRTSCGRRCVLPTGWITGTKRTASRTFAPRRSLATKTASAYEDIATEEFENIHNLFAAILAKGIGRQLKQGLYREYLNQKETVTAVRGKIDIPGTIQNRLARRQVLTCEYDELSENNLLNQILKTTVMLLLCHARVDQAYKSDLKKEMLFFSNVDTIDPAAICWSAIRFQRNNNTYRTGESLCAVFI